MNVLAEITDDFLARHFDAATLQRARGILTAGAVPLPEIGKLSADTVTATAQVQGTREVPYQVQLHIDAPKDDYQGWLFTVCTCPVRSLCKHGAAVALALRRSFTGAAAPGSTTWRPT
ncbi:MAG: SWIM zinc finger family protein, partial [Nocardioidaceae bacterium]|nr:SWIM zinc finger family protein [Nocardioidaceae bacterium]